MRELDQVSEEQPVPQHALEGLGEQRLDRLPPRALALLLREKRGQVGVRVPQLAQPPAGVVQT
eukprot:1970477-Rhodomonas_salina.1